MSIRNFRAHWRYLVSAGLSILFGMWGLLLFSLYVDDLTDLLDSVWQKRYMLGDIIVVNEASSSIGGSHNRISSEQQKWIYEWIGRNNKLIAQRIAVLEGKGTIELGGVSTIFLGKGLDKNSAAELRGEKWKWDAVAGLPLHLGKFDQDLVVGQRLSRILGCNYGSYEDELPGSGFVARERPYSCPSYKVSLKGTTDAGYLNTAEGKIIGLVDGFFREIDSRLVVMSIEQAQRLFNTDSISYLVLKLKDSRVSAEIIRSLQNEMNEAGLGLNVLYWKNFREADIYRRAVTVTKIFQIFILCIMGIIGGLCIVYSFRKNTEERAKEIGTLRSLGFYRRHIVAIFGIEASILTVVCTIGAVVLTIVTAHIVNGQEIMYQVGGLNRPVQFTIGNSVQTYVRASLALLWLAPVTACLSALVVILRPISLNLMSK